MSSEPLHVVTKPNIGTTCSSYSLVVCRRVRDNGGWNTKSPRSGSSPIQALVLTLQGDKREGSSNCASRGGFVQVP